MRIYDCNDEVGSTMDLLKVSCDDFTDVIEWCKMIKLHVYGSHIKISILARTWLIAFFLSMW